MGKLFVITRSDIPLEDQSVQSGHSVAEWMLNNPGHEWQNGTLVYLSIQDLAHLEMLCLKLKSRMFEYSVFVEPDINNEMTSIAVYDADSVLKKFKLWKV